MINSPLGKIYIFIDNKPYEYQEYPYLYKRPAVADNPVTGCYRIKVPSKNASSVRCVFVMENDGAEIFVTSGENFLGAEFTNGNTQLVIGMIDDSTLFESFQTENVLEYKMRSDVEEVVFGVAWVLDNNKDDCRTWYAADPSMDNHPK